MDPMVEAAVYQRYPSLRGLLGIPEVGELLVRAVDPNAPLSDQEFERQLHETYWWKTTPASTRDAIIRGVEDPATVYQEKGKIHAGILDWALDTGVVMDEGTRAFVSGAMHSAGETVNDPGAQLALRNFMRSHPQSMQPGGRWAAATQNVYALARREYFLPVEWWWAQGWAVGLVTGETDEATLKESLLAHSKAMYPHLSDWIIQGMSPAQIINPLRQIAADELEVSIEQIDPGRPEWKMLTGVTNEGRDPEAAQAWRMPTASEVQEQARRQSVWWETAKGRQTDAGMARSLLSAFGKSAF